MNFLEQLLAEWYSFQGYFVRTNVRARKRAKGGWDNEIDVLAYSPSDKTLYHIETSGDALSWEKRKNRFLEKKFIFTHDEYKKILKSDVNEIIKIAVVGFSKSPKVNLAWRKDIQVQPIPDLLKEITDSLKKLDFQKEAVPEGFPLLRIIQMTLQYGVL